MAVQTSRRKQIIRTRPIGYVFNQNGKKYKVCKGKGCDGCDFFKEGNKTCNARIDLAGLCFHGMRSDGVDVVFKEVKDERD